MPVRLSGSKEKDIIFLSLIKVSGSIRGFEGIIVSPIASGKPSYLQVNLYLSPAAGEKYVAGRYIVSVLTVCDGSKENTTDSVKLS